MNAHHPNNDNDAIDLAPVPGPGPDNASTPADAATEATQSVTQPVTQPIVAPIAPPIVQDGPTRGTHPVNVLHLVMGVVFLGLVTIWGLFENEIASTDDLRWLIPLPWVIAGAASLIVLTMSGRRRTD
ncbi:MAG: hypothetical protein ACRCYU_10640 [Nocardioides sp.]